MTRTEIFTAYIGRNADRERTYVTVESDTTNIRPGRLTVDHKPAEATGPELSISGWTLRYRGRSWSHGGQIVDDLAHMTEIADGWKLSDVRSLYRIWREFHLNGMTAACSHMPANVREVYDTVDRPWVKVNADGSPRELPAEIVCPETGYTYGSAWLVKQVPADVWAELRRLSELPRGEINHGIG